ncbi:MAG: transcription elongation factor GreA [Rickettsiales bacterium]|nr:transcription elongation factor GreA [Pseudomonadota bacterium]MDA0965853.1 transcription elongation factor GreA [Pseudomonadota bacterium]MDG4542677.1 transcription elongation factor GreA [Rickettsiales bacterium]MDG4545181.1 transcription elongation factor GreA [Rickettsiales bacterium]MDG4547304.1 transcription elongation factor GreA [Rickettsiales bacterium]
MSDNFPITNTGFARMEAELKDLKKIQRPKISEEIAVAREHGDLKENAEYHAAREKQSFVEGRIAELEDRVARAEVIDISKLTPDTVKFGATVTLIDDETEKEVTYQIVSEYEADIEKNLISVVSPLAKAIIGKQAEDYVEVKTPRGEKGYEIVKIEYR